MFKTQCAPQRRGRQTKYAQGGKIYRRGRLANLPQWVKILNKFKQAFDAAHKILIKFRRTIPLRRIKFCSAMA